MLNPDSQRVARDTGMLVYLRLPVETLAKRLFGATNRPLLLGPDGGILSKRALSDRIEFLLAEREPFYAQADFVVDVENLDPEYVAGIITDSLDLRA